MLTITTVKTARMALRGGGMTLGELAALVEQCAEKNVPDDATVTFDQSQAHGVVAGSLRVTWTAAVAA